jgi:transposase
MAGRQSSATDRALARIKAGETAYAAAKVEGIALSTIYRALRRIREARPKKRRK